MRTSLLAAVTATALLFPALAVAQEPQPVTAENAETLEEQVGLPTSRDRAPDTDTCPYLDAPPPARTTSEAGTPTPLPVPETPAGGPRMAECGIVAGAGFEAPAEVTAAAWTVFDIDSGEILTAKDPHGRHRPASIIKVLIGLLAIEELAPDTVVTGTREAADIEGSRVGVGEGGNYTVDQLLHGLLLASGNDAAHLLAQELGGDAATLRKANELAGELGARDTRVASYSGLDAAGMATSAYDMALLYRHAWRTPAFAAIIDTEYIDFPGWGDNEGFQVWNDNGLFMNDPDGIGGKTGYTDDANHTFVGGLDRDGRRIGVVILDTTANLARPWEQARLLIDASLAAGGEVGALSTDTVAPTPAATPTQVPTSGGDAVDIARIALPIGAILLLLLAALLWTFRRR